MRTQTPPRTAVLTLLAALLLFSAIPASPSFAATPGVNGAAGSLSGAFFGAAHPGEPLPGSDDWGCTPTAEHPQPVVLLHGTGMNAWNTWAPMAAALSLDGFCVFAPTYGALPGAPSIGGMTSIVERSGPEMAAYIDRVLATTGATSVSLVGHSEGAPVAAYLAKSLRPGRVSSVVFLAGYWMRPGTTTISAIPALGWIRTEEQLQHLIRHSPVVSGADLVRPSALIDAVWSGGSPFRPDVRYTSISSTYDEVFPPWVAGADVPGSTDLVLQAGCPANRTGHLTIPFDPRAIDLVRHALGGSSGPVSCVPTDPLLGPVGPVGSS